MKKILTLALLLFLVGCTTDDMDKEMDSPESTPVTEQPTTPAETPVTEEPMEEMPVEMVYLTLDELAMYNGTDMEMMYIAVDGVIYDVTGVAAWASGEHNGYMVGTDVTEGINMAPHGVDPLEDLTMVGYLFKAFDLEMLSMYDGVQMEMMYIAANGYVYDVTNVAAWASGEHNGYMVGTDVTEGINMAPHGVDPLEDLTMVGYLLKTFDLEMLSMYDGVQMEMMYIAVDGYVYDVTGVAAWASGEHNGYKVGTDVTEGIMMAPHGTNPLDGLMMVGVLEVMEFSMEDLAMYNGMDMPEMYIAVDGIVYDVTDNASWASGSHQGYMVGTDVTEGFEMSPHAMATLDDLIIVGIYTG